MGSELGRAPFGVGPSVPVANATSPSVPHAHTPGPWDVTTFGAAGFEVQGGASQVALVRPVASRGREQAHADALLIAAAPDLLAALIRFCDREQDWMRSCDGEGDCLDMTPSELAKPEEERMLIRCPYCQMWDAVALVHPEYSRTASGTEAQVRSTAADGPPVAQANGTPA